IDYQMFSIWIVNEREHVLENRFALRFGERFYTTEKLPLEGGLVGTAITERRLIHSPDVRKDPRYRMFNPETRSEMAMPLIYKGKVIGVLDIEHTRAHFFNEDHERALTTLAAQIAISIENARLYQRVAQQEQRLESDLAMAREVQLRLLPPFKPKHARAEFAAKFLPARTLGGAVCGAGKRHHAIRGDCASLPLGDAEDAQRFAAGAPRRFAVRDHALLRLE